MSAAVWLKRRASRQSPPLGARLDLGRARYWRLAGAWLFNERSGGLIAGHAGSPPATAVGSRTWGVGRNGPVLRLNGSGDYVVLGARPDTTGDFAISFEATPADSAGKVLLYLGPFGGAGFYVQANRDAANSLSFVSGTVHTATATGTFIPGSTYRVLILRVGPSVRIFLNGQEAAYSTVGAHTFTTSTENFQIGRYASSTGFDFNGAIGGPFLILNRALNTREIAELNDSPFTDFSLPDFATVITPTTFTRGPIVRLRRVRGSQKPPLGARLDPTDPLNLGLKLFVLDNESGGAARNLVNGKAGTITGTLGWGITPEGPGRDSPTPGIAAYETIDHDPLTPVAITYQWRGVFDQFRATSPFISGIFGANTTIVPVMMRLGDSTLANNRVQVQLAAGSKLAGSATRAAIVGQPIDIVVTCDGITLALYINGVLDATRTFDGNTAATWSQTKFFVDDTASRSMDGRRILARAWDRALSAAEVAELWRNPYRGLQGPALFTPLLAVAPDPGSGTPLYLGGTAGGAGHSSANLQLIRQLTGASVGAGLVSGSTQISRRLVGSSTGNGTTTTALGIARRLNGEAKGAGTPSAAVKIRRLLTGVSTGIGRTTSVFFEPGIHLSGVCVGVGTTSATLRIGRPLQAGSSGAGVTTGTLLLRRLLTGSATGVGDTTSGLTLTGPVELLRYIVTWEGASRPVAVFSATPQPVAILTADPRPIGTFED